MASTADSKLDPDGAIRTVDTVTSNTVQAVDLLAVLAQHGPERVQRAVDLLAEYTHAVAVGALLWNNNLLEWSAQGAVSTLSLHGEAVEPEIERVTLQWIDDLQRTKRLHELTAANPKVHAAFVAPLQSAAGEVIGCLFVGLGGSNRFEDETRSVLSAFRSALGASLARERAVDQHRERYVRLMEQAADSIFVLDNRLNVVDVNRMCCEMLGYTRDELTQLNLNDILDPDELSQTPVPWLQSPGDILRTERVMRRKDGGQVLVEANVTLLDNGLIQGIARDIGERK